MLRAHHYIFENEPESIQILLKILPQPVDVAEHSHENELKGLTSDGQMTDTELDLVANRVGDKKRPPDEVRTSRWFGKR